MRTGALVDGGQDCTLCHRTFAPANSDPNGRVQIVTSRYSPGVKQVVQVRLEHPEASRWGFQLTARLASDETRQAGTFTVPDVLRIRCGPDNRDAPCNGAVEFAMHRREGTSPGTTGGKTFEVEWTPPASDVGDVIFYVAGNAANNNNTNSGDRIYTVSQRVSPACMLTGRPTVRAVVNAASFQPGITFNSMISIFGSGFAAAGASRAASRADFVEGRFPSELSCAAVEVDGRRAPVTFVGPTQINAQAPTSPVVGPVGVRVILNPGQANEIRSDMLPAVPQRQHSPALFTFFSNGRNAAAQHLNFDLLADPAVVAGARPAAPGDSVILYGTGFGVTEPVFQAGELPDRGAPLRDPFTVIIDGLALRREDILYAGVSPGSISGLYQFNVRLPASTGSGDIPVAIEIGGVRTPSGVSIRVRRP